MRDGFVKIAAGTPKIKVADCMYNAEQIIALMKEAAGQGVKVLSLPGAVLHRLHLRRPVPPAHPAQRGGGRAGPHPGGDRQPGPAHRRRDAHPVSE